MFTFFFWLCFVLLTASCLLLILLVLAQKARGGGVIGAMSGSGGDTAFGPKAVQVITWITSIMFGIFMLLAVVMNLISNAAVGSR